MRTTSGSFQFTDQQLVTGLIALMMMALVGMIPASVFAQNAAPATVQNSQVPQPQDGGVNWEGVGYGVGTLAGNIFYVPAKLVYALSGGLIGGGAYLLTGGNSQAANTIWRSSLGGDYVVTPDMLAGKTPLHFAGPTETAPLPTDSTVQPITTIPASNAPEYSANSTQGPTTASR